MPVKSVIEKYPNKQEYLLEMLIDIDELKKDHCVSEEDIIEISTYLNVKISHIYSVMSFYTMLSTKPRGKFIVQICKDVPCYLNDSFNLKNTVCDYLDCAMGETTKSKLFTVEFTACLGCCDESPAMRINKQTYTNLTKGKVITILEEYEEGKYD
jgi:NADH:ubiquinone oxidoreductase subunit E